MLLTALISEQSKDDEALDEEFVDENAAGGDGDDDDVLLLFDFTFQLTNVLLLDGIVTKLRTIFIWFLFCIQSSTPFYLTFVMMMDALD